MENLFKHLREWGYVALLVVIGAALAGLTYPSLLGKHNEGAAVEFSSLAAIVIKSVLGLVLARTALAALFPYWSLKYFRKAYEVETESRANIFISLIIGIFFIVGMAVASAQPPTRVGNSDGAARAKAAPAHLALALSYENVVERPRNSNNGREVAMFLRHVGLDPGHPWCAAFTSFCLDRANAASPLVRSAVARAFITQGSIAAREVSSGAVRVPPGTLVVWRRGTGPLGHVGFVVRQLGPARFETVEGNTSPGARGSQFDGGGVYVRIRTIAPTDAFRITHFTLVTYRA